jgi:DNA-directed RNA polymerase specialized sigma24 family protein
LSPLALRRYRAERLLRKEFSGLRSKVLTIVRSQLRGKGIKLDPADLEACYAQAWHGLYATMLRGEQVDNPSAWLVLVTFRRAIDESRSAGRHRAGREARWDAAPGELGWERQQAASEHDLAGGLDDRVRLRHVFEGLRAHLSERECEAASLCYLQGLSRAEAAGRMGISEARMGKLMEGAGPGRPGVAGKVGVLLETIRAGGWCEEQASLMRAYAFGILAPDGERHALAVAHCRECPACRAHVASLRGLAAVLPLPLFSPLALAGGTGTIAVVRVAGSGNGVAGSGNGVAGSGNGVAGSGNGVAGSGNGVAGATNGVAGATASGGPVGGGATGTGWSGLASSLTAKLAVTALAVLGAGYAVLGSRAHGSSPAQRAAAAPLPVAHEPLSQALLQPLSPPARGGRSTRRSSAPHPRPSRGVLSPGEVTGSEFGPERVRRESRAAPSAPTTPPAGSPRNSSRAHEFGIE